MSNNKDNFWTDELVLEFAVRSQLPGHEVTIQEFKESKQVYTIRDIKLAFAAGQARNTATPTTKGDVYQPLYIDFDSYLKNK